MVSLSQIKRGGKEREKERYRKREGEGWRDGGREGRGAEVKGTSGLVIFVSNVFDIIVLFVLLEENCTRREFARKSLPGSIIFTASKWDMCFQLIQYLVF